MKDKIIKLLDDWKVNKHKQELIAEELLILCGVVKPSCEHKVKVLTKDEVEKGRSNAYKYLDL